MDKDLEILTAAGVGGLFRRAKKPYEPPPPGTLCLNCGHALTGRFCAECGQPTDLHHRSILHLIWEGIESVLHVDGRLWRTLPALFVRPGTLSKDYFEGRIFRHMPPFRTFLVALLVFIVSAEHDVDAGRRGAMAEQAQREAKPLSPAVRAAAADKMRREAAAEFASESADAARERDGALKDPDERAGAEPLYQKAIADLKASRDRDLKKADDVAAGKALPDHNRFYGTEEERRAEAERLRALAKTSGGLKGAITFARSQSRREP